MKKKINEDEATTSVNNIGDNNIALVPPLLGGVPPKKRKKPLKEILRRNPPN